MATNKINPLAFKYLKATEFEQNLSDGGGLFVRVRSINDGGSIKFRFCYRFDGKQRWVTLKAKGLSEARSERDSYKLLHKTGVDPGLEKDLEKERKRIYQIEELAAIIKLQSRVTVNKLFIEWCETDIIRRADLSEIKRMFAKDVLPDLGELFVEDVRKGDVTLIIGKLKKRQVDHLARNILKLIRQMFRFAVNYDLIEFDPTASLNITKITTAPTERDRYLSEQEIQQLANQLPHAGFLKSTECAIWIALSTMCRIGELSKAKFSDLDLELKTWTIPKENSKNKKVHKIYLSDFALEQFKNLTDIATHPIWLFPNRYGTDHVCEKSITKQVDGRQTTNILSNRSKNNQALVLSGGKWTPHDLRRSGSTLLGSLGYDSDVIDRSLNHKEPNKMKRTYQLQKLEREKKQAWHELGERLSLLTNTELTDIDFLEV